MVYIAHLQCQWVLSSEGLTSGCGIEDVILTMGVEGMKMFVAGANATKQPSGKVVELRGGEQRYSDWLLQRSGKGHAMSVLNMLFTEWKSVLHVHELYLRLPVACDCITWPDLSALRVLNLGIIGQTNWRLDTLLSHLTLESLTIKEHRADRC